MIGHAHIDYAGTTPTGDHIAISMKEWSDICFAIGYAAETDKDHPLLRRAAAVPARSHPIIRFEATDA